MSLLKYILLSVLSAGQVVTGPKPQQRGGGLLHPGWGPGPGHAGGPHRILLQVTKRGQENEGGGPGVIGLGVMGVCVWREGLWGGGGGGALPPP